MNSKDGTEKLGLWLSPTLFHCPELTDGEVILLSLIENIASLGKGKNGVSIPIFYGSSKYLASKLRGSPSENSIDCMINRLVKKEFLIRTSRKFKVGEDIYSQIVYKTRRVLQINYNKIQECYDKEGSLEDSGEYVEDVEILDSNFECNIEESPPPVEPIVPTIDEVTKSLIVEKEQQELARRRKAQRKEEQRNSTIKRAIDRSDAIKDFLLKNHLPPDGELGKKMRAIVSGNKKNTKLPQPQLKAQLEMLQQMLDKSDEKTITNIINRHWTSNHMALIYENELNPSERPKYNSSEPAIPQSNPALRPPANKQTGVKIGKGYMYLEEITPEIFIKHIGGEYFMDPENASKELIEIAAWDYFSVIPWDLNKYLTIPDEIFGIIDSGGYLDAN